MSLLIDPYRFTSLTYDQEVLADSPSAYWKCDETSGTTVVDSSGFGRDLGKGSSVTVGAAAVMPSGLRSYDFAGSGNVNNSVNTADATWQSSHAGASGQMSLESWAEFDSLAAINTLWWKGIVGGFEYNFAILTTGAVQFAVFTPAGGTVAIAQSAASVVTTATPYHLVGTYDRAGDFAKVYVEGSEVATTTTAANSADGGGAFIYGYRSNNNDRFLNGRSSHLAFYPTALSATRVLAHYNAA